ncbi:MAG TPA: basic amino acid ABC transporter substrate-binding protein [Acidimicrobiales bacterium]|nr:basic amino acid ABC transporter substrate-binding protein [Acidimicrobiales bacterium]
MRSRSPRRFAALVAVAALTLAAACGDSDGDDLDSGSGSGMDDATATTADAADIEETVEEGTLTVCTDIPYAPFEYEEDGEVKGIDVDLMRALAAKLGLEAEFRDTDFDGIFASLEAGNCDVIASSVSITEERKKENDFTDGYFEIQQSLLVREGEEEEYADFASLKGRTIGVQSETTGAAFATEECEQAGCEIKEFTGADDLFTALKAKQIDGVVQDFPINSYNAETTGDTVVSATFDGEEAEEYGFVVPKDKPKLLEALNTALGELREDGEYDEILEEYLGAEATSS